MKTTQPPRPRRIKFDIRDLSFAQLVTLHIGAVYKLRRSSLGWWAYNSPSDKRSRVKKGPIEIIPPNTVKSLWNRGLLAGNFCEAKYLNQAFINPDASAKSRVWVELQTTIIGIRIIRKITQETGIYFDKTKDRIVDPFDDDYLIEDDYDKPHGPAQIIPYSRFIKHKNRKRKT